MTEKINHFRDLQIWEKGINLVKNIYSSTNNFPTSETYGLVSQMRRSAVSIPSNIAEGFKRYHNNEFRQFLYISLGSCAELETQLVIANELNYINYETRENIIEDINHVSRMIYNLIKKLWYIVITYKLLYNLVELLFINIPLTIFFLFLILFTVYVIRNTVYKVFQEVFQRCQLSLIKQGIIPEKYLQSKG